MSIFPEECARCGESPGSYTCSYFNVQWICSVCSEKERQHPLYSKAVEADNDAVRKGNYWYKGIGLPDDLK